MSRLNVANGPSQRRQSSSTDTAITDEGIHFFFISQLFFFVFLFFCRAKINNSKRGKREYYSVHLQPSSQDGEFLQEIQATAAVIMQDVHREISEINIHNDKYIDENQ